MGRAGVSFCFWVRVVAAVVLLAVVYRCIARACCCTGLVCAYVCSVSAVFVWGRCVRLAAVMVRRVRWGVRSGVCGGSACWCYYVVVVGGCVSRGVRGVLCLRWCCAVWVLVRVAFWACRGWCAWCAGVWRVLDSCHVAELPCVGVSVHRACGVSAQGSGRAGVALCLALASCWRGGEVRCWRSWTRRQRHLWIQW